MTGQFLFSEKNRMNLTLEIKRERVINVTESQELKLVQTYFLCVDSLLVSLKVNITN